MPKPPSDYIQELAAIARHRHLWWTISCIAKFNRDTPYIAEFRQTKEDVLWEEDGGKPRWIGEGTTQEDAARVLLENVAEYPKPNHVFRHELPKAENEPPIQCDPDIGGGPE